MAAPAIGLTITAADKTTAVIDRINGRIEAFGKRTQLGMERATAPFQAFQRTIKTFGDVSGLTRVGGAVRGLARAGGDAYQKVGQIVPLLGIIGSAATVAGIARMVTTWADWGSKVGFTAQRIGISAEKLSGFQGAARLAGSSADGMANGLQSLGQTMYDAIGGRAPEATVMFRTLGIAFQDASGHARSVADVLPQVADKIKDIRDPFAQAQVAATLFGGAAEDLLPFLRRGSTGIREYVDAARRYGAISDASAAAANRLREAQARVSLAVDGLRNHIAQRLEPILTPLLTHLAEWIATSPQVARGVERLGVKVGELGSYLSNVDWAAVERRWEAWGDKIAYVVDKLGGPERVIEGLIALMVGSFALKVIAPFAELGLAVGSATLKMTGLISQTRTLAALQAAGGGKGGLLGRLGGLAGGLGLAAMGWEGADLLSGATEPQGNGIANLLHNMMFDMNPMHWTPSYHPGQEGAPGSTAARGLGSRPPAGAMDAPTGDAAAREKQAYDYFVSQGRSSQAAAGIVASLQGEGASLNEKALGDYVNGVPTAYGIGQWHKDRQDHFAQIFGHPMQNSTLMEQLQFKQMELSGTGGDAGSETAGKMMSRPGITAREAGAADSMYAERPGDKLGQAQYRGARGEQVYARQTAMQPPAATAPAIAAPAAQGAPMQMASAADPGKNAQGSDSTIRLHIEGDSSYRARVMENQDKVPVSGPLVERPALLGANP